MRLRSASIKSHTWGAACSAGGAIGASGATADEAEVGTVANELQLMGLLQIIQCQFSRFQGMGTICDRLNSLRAEIWSKITLGRCSRSHHEAECRRSGKGATSRALARICRQNKACGTAAKPRSSSSTGSHNWDGGGEEARGTVQCVGCNKTCRLL